MSSHVFFKSLKSYMTMGNSDSYYVSQMLSKTKGKDDDNSDISIPREATIKSF